MKELTWAMHMGSLGTVFPLDIVVVVSPATFAAIPDRGIFGFGE